MKAHRDNTFRRQLRLQGVQGSFDYVSASRSEADTSLRTTALIGILGSCPILVAVLATELALSEVERVGILPFRPNSIPTLFTLRS